MQWDRKAGRRRIPRHLLVTYLLQEHPEVFYVNPQSLNAHSMLCKQITKEDQLEQNMDRTQESEEKTFPESSAWTYCCWSTPQAGLFSGNTHILASCL